MKSCTKLPKRVKSLVRRIQKCKASKAITEPLVHGVSPFGVAPPISISQMKMSDRSPVSNAAGAVREHVTPLNFPHRHVYDDSRIRSKGGTYLQLHRQTVPVNGSHGDRRTHSRSPFHSTNAGTCSDSYNDANTQNYGKNSNGNLHASLQDEQNPKSDWCSRPQMHPTTPVKRSSVSPNMDLTSESERDWFAFDNTFESDEELRGW